MDLANFTSLQSSLNSLSSGWIEDRNKRTSMNRAGSSADYGFDNLDHEPTSFDTEPVPEEPVNQKTKLFDDSQNIDITLLRDLGFEIQSQLMQQFPGAELERQKEFVRHKAIGESDIDYQRLVDDVNSSNSGWSKRKSKEITIDLGDLGNYKLVEAQSVTNAEQKNKPVAVSFTLSKSNKNNKGPQEIFLNLRLKRSGDTTTTVPSFISLRDKDRFVSYTYYSSRNSAKIVYNFPNMGKYRGVIDTSDAKLYMDFPFMPRKNIGRVAMLDDLHKAASKKN